MIGIIVWALLIIWICCATGPFFTMMCVLLPIAGVLYALLDWLFEKIKGDKEIYFEDLYIKHFRDEEIEKERDEWERKYGLKHPSRLRKEQEEAEQKRQKN